MKLKNKKTGEIVEWFDDTNGVFPDSLAELNEEWEDVFTEEVWYLGERIGNYSMPKKEARKVTEKILAWKRLKDKGFSIYSWDYEFDMVDKPAQTIILRASAVDNSNKDLDICFGGEE